MDSTIIAAIIGFIAIIIGALIPVVIKLFRHRSEKPPINITDISGTWNVYVSESKSSLPNARFEIKQDGKKITATCQYLTKKDGTEKKMLFDYSGVYWAGQMVLTFYQREVPDMAIGAVVLKLIDKNKFVGRTTFWHHEKHYLDGDDFQLIRE